MFDFDSFSVGLELNTQVKLSPNDFTVDNTMVSDLDSDDIAYDNFFEATFDFDDDASVIKSNYDKALRLYYSAYYEMHLISEQICDGEIVVIDSLKNAVSSLKNGYKAYIHFRNILRPNEMCVSLVALGFPENNSEELSHKGNDLKAQANQSPDLLIYEEGVWLCFLAKMKNKNLEEKI